MVETQSLILFIFTIIFLALAPGPDNLFVLTQGITNGKKASIVTTLGFSTGVIFHTLAVAFGLTIIFQTSDLAFNIVKFLGAGYLFYLAYQIFKNRNEPILIEKNRKVLMKKLYFQAVLMNILNPKVSIFFLAFLPQFISKETGNIELQIILLGFIFMINTIIIFGAIGILANILSKPIVNNPIFSKSLNYITSSIFFLLATKLAFEER